MKRTIPFLWASSLAILFFQCELDERMTTNERTNIVLIMSDDMGYSDIGCYGSEVRTPNLDGLAENGLRFTQFYNTARCCPTRASLLTGLHPHQTGIGHMVDQREPNGAYQGDLNDQCVTIAQVLKAAGYQTYLSGKWHVTNLNKNKFTPNKKNWPLQRGFDRFFGTIHGAGSFYDPNSLTSGNEFIAPPGDFYYTDAISDTAVKFIDEHPIDQPFFMYVAYTAAHWPMQALPKDIKKYQGQYDEGWEAIREKRVAKMKELGLIKPVWSVSDPYPNTPWEEQGEKDFHARCMEVYAAMIDNMDQGIGRIIKALDDKGQLDNTLILFLQDNGACAETYGFGKKERTRIKPSEAKPMAADALQYNMVPLVTRDGRPVRTGYGVMPGPADTYVGYAKEWANVSNTPFKMFKHWVHEGGIATPLIAHWPQGIQETGGWREQPGQLMDIMATCVDVAGATYPDSFNYKPILPMEGVSLVPAFDNQSLARDTLYWEHEGNRAIRIGNWKLVSRAYAWPFEHDTIPQINPSEWMLYDLEADRTETNNLATQYPERVQEMADAWYNWSLRANVWPKPVLHKFRPGWAGEKVAVE